MGSKYVLLTKVACATVLAVAITGCSGDGDLQGRNEDRVTVGTVQQQIRIGMSTAEVVEALGSPNVITTDDQRREVWVYDKFATKIVTSGGYWTVIFGGQQGGTRSKSQRTLTVIIKFDEAKRVRDFAYHASSF